MANNPLVQEMTKDGFLRNKTLAISGIITTDQNPEVRARRLTFVNNIRAIQKVKLDGYNCWYVGDCDSLLNYYTRSDVIEFNYDPIYNRNSKSFFWSVSSKEGDIKRTHSGQPRNIVDTLVSIIGVPRISVGTGESDSVLNKVNDRLKDILEENNIEKLLLQEARPLTLVEGWGAWKINWDKSVSDNPILVYYRADSVDFIYVSKRLRAIVYSDYFQDEMGTDYVLFETRRIDNGNLIIEKELFVVAKGGSETITPVPLSDLPCLKDIKPQIIIENYNGFLGYPCIYYYDSTGDCYGRSIYTGKESLFDDLDQCLSQSANTVRRSTPQEYFDVMYLEKDENGLPKMPQVYDRKYIQVQGGLTGDGSTGGNMPVTVTQPRLDFTQYDTEAQHIMIEAISGVMSPATLGIDIAKKDNADAAREKEKVTIFTRNVIIKEEKKIWKHVCNDLLIAQELMRTGKASCVKYDIDVVYDEYADASWESVLQTVLTGWQAGILSDQYAVDALHKDATKEIKDRELEFLRKNREKEDSMNAPQNQGMFGELGADNPYNRAMNAPAESSADMREDVGLPREDLADYKDIHG